MSIKRRERTTDPNLSPPFGTPLPSLRLDLVTSESEDELDAWSPQDRQLFDELIEDAASELQRELLRRSLAAGGHRPAELHAFADTIRPLTDDRIFSACTLSAERAARESVEERLWAEADPVYAYLLNGHRLSPRDDSPPPPVKLPPGMMIEPPTVPVMPRKMEEEIADAPRREDTRAKVFAVGAGRFAEDLFNEAVKPLGLAFVEQPVDGAGLPLEKALAAAADALARGVPIPVLLGATEGDYRRYALLLQVQLSGGRHVFQLHDPFDRETVWINEGDFLLRTELPLSDKAHRRITSIALPRKGWK